MRWPEDLPRFELTIGECGYPSHLAQLRDAPRTLYGIGHPECLVPALGAVGARRATPYGLQAADMLVGWAARAGYTVVSGGAIGCDQAAHRAALGSAGPTVAVLAGGADIAYPRTSDSLLMEIAERGAVVSEHPWGAEPTRWMFRTRNRIIAGLSVSLLVLEAALGSGTFSTADYALEAGRDVLAVPGSIFAPECAGSNRLIRQGATPVTDASELRDALESILGPPTCTPSPPLWADAVSGDEVLSAIRTNPMRPDDAARQLGMDIVTVARRLGMLETAGLVTRHRDGRYGPAR